MGLFSKKSAAAKPPPTTSDRPLSQGDDRYPGIAGYVGFGQKKGSMPAYRFKFVRPDGKSDR